MSPDRPFYARLTACRLGIETKEKPFATAGIRKEDRLLCCLQAKDLT